jgi:hypothetical protein
MASGLVRRILPISRTNGVHQLCSTPPSICASYVVAKNLTRTSDLVLSTPWCCKRTFVDSPSLVYARYYSVAMVAFTHSQLFALSTLLVIASGLSTLRTCTDGSCARSNKTIDLLNSYRNTTCKPLNIVVGGSFQIVQLDPGCIGKSHRFLH